jgi:hypothetical protein
MYMVYWTEAGQAGKRAEAKEFESHDMMSAMKFMEELRARQRAGEGIAYVALSSENPHSVGHAGVAEPSPHYNWKKRRQ